MRDSMKKFLTRDKATTFADVLGGMFITLGVWLSAGLGAGLITAGVLILALSYLVAE